MKKKLTLVCLVLLLLSGLMLLSACHELAEGFDEDVMFETGSRVIELCNDRDYEAVIAMFDLELLGEASGEDLAEQFDPILDDLGQFQEFKTYASAGSQDGNSGMELGIIAIRCAYENGKGLYTITMTEDYKLVGLFLQ